MALEARATPFAGDLDGGEGRLRRLLNLTRLATGCAGAALMLDGRILRVGEASAAHVSLAIEEGRLELTGASGANLEDIAALFREEILRQREQAAIEDLRQSESRLRIAVEDAELYVYDADFQRGVLRTAGAADTFFEQPITLELLRNDPWSTVDPRDRGPAEAHWRACQASGERFAMEYRTARADGREVWAHSTIRIVPGKDGRGVRVIGTLQNITDRKRSEADARSARTDAEVNAQRLAFALNAAHTAAWELDPAGPTLIGGEELSKFFGQITAEEVINLHKTRLVPADLPAYRDFSQRLQAGERADIEHRIVRTDGRIQWVHTTGAALTGNEGGTPRYIFLTTDITDRRRAEAAFAEAMAQATASLDSKRALLEAIVSELGGACDSAPSAPAPTAPIAEGLSALHDQLSTLLREIGQRDVMLGEAVGALKDARAAAQAGSEAKTRFLNAMTHELRTPLNAIINYAELIQEDAPSETASSIAADADRILAAARALLQIITHVIEYSELDAGKASFDVQDVSVSAFVASIEPELNAQGLAKGIRTNTLVAPDVGAIRTDPAALRRCMAHLMSNAFKFTAKGLVEVRARRSGAWVEIEILDTGCGMDPRHAPDLLSPFVQADGSLSRAHGGSGLGLAITGQLARRLGGSLSFTSAPGKGSAFALRLPASSNGD